MDFAVTSGLRRDHLFHSSIDPSHALMAYEDYKRNYQGTADACMQQGLQFFPMVVEGHGGS